MLPQLLHRYDSIHIIKRGLRDLGLRHSHGTVSSNRNCEGERSLKRATERVLIAMLALGTAQAGTGSGTVTNITPAVSNGTEFFVVTLSTMSGQPSCTSSSRLALSATDPRYKTIISILLGAYFSGASVYANGAGTCNTYPGGAEDLAYVCLDGGAPC
jgi:hypothetical protein